MNEDRIPGRFPTSNVVDANNFGTAIIDANTENVIALSENIFMYSNRRIGQHHKVYEGEVQSSVYGVRPCVIKFAVLSEQNTREAEILTKLGSHTNIIAIIQSGTYYDLFEEHVYIALDKCHKENLRQYLANREAAEMEFDLNQAIDFAKQIIVGVMYIHENNVIHLDLKPSNILISQDLRLIKIADFGASIVVKSPKSKVFHKGQFGTNGYRPIESFGNGVVSMRTDIFSLGTVLKHVFSNGNDVFGHNKHVIVQNVQNDVTDTSGLLVDNPATTEHLIKCMVSKERCRRPNIWEVSDHPCWSGKEVECDYEYCADDEMFDTAEGSDVAKETPVAELSDIERGRAFVKSMREMGFNRKPTVVIFDDLSHHLYRFDQKNKSIITMQKYPDGIHTRDYSAVSSGEFIYIFKRDRSVYRLEYGDVKATWQRKKDSLCYHQRRPLATASSEAGLIFLLGSSKMTLGASKSVFMYRPSLDEWERLQDRPVGSYPAALLCNDKYLYCIGCFVDHLKAKFNERMDLQTKQWERIADFNKQLTNELAVEYKGEIYVTGWVFKGKYVTIEIFDPKLDLWTELKTNGPAYLKWVPHITRCFEIDGILYLVSGDVIIKYDVEKMKWGFVTTFHTDIIVKEAVLVKMST